MEININSDSRRILLLLVMAFSITAGWGYLVYLEPIWGYFGLRRGEITVDTWIYSTLFCVAPVLFMPPIIKRPSMFAIWLLYVFTYIPMVIGVYFDYQVVEDSKITICLVYFFGFYLLNSFNKVKLFTYQFINLPKKYFWIIFYIITFLSLGYVLVIFRGNLTFANLIKSEEVYGLRASGTKIQDNSLGAGHLIMWLGNAFLPFILAVGFVQKDNTKKVVGIVGQIILYMTMANKQYLLSILFTLAIYYLFRSKIRNKVSVFLFGVTSLSIFLLYFFNSASIPGLKELVFTLSGMFLLRTVYTSTLMSVYYNVFFENESHPYTYYSHISGLNKLIKYPYDRPLGVEVGSYFIDFGTNNANANFFLTDGISAIGLSGILLISLLCAFVFYLYDSLASKSNQLLAILLISNSAIALMNVSLFTTLLSGGLFFFMILINNDELLKDNDV